MKIRDLLYIIGTILIMSSCASSFYQVYDVKPIERSVTKTDELFYADKNCKITYNLWAEEGNIGFNFYNKSDSVIYVKLNESNFILNGFAHDYFKNRTFTVSESKSASTSTKATGSVAVTGVNTFDNVQTNKVKSSSAAHLSSSVGYAVSTKEDSIIRIPPQTTKRISEYSINDKLIRDCDLLKYPKAKKVKTVSYTKENSPLVFSNRITYEVNGHSKVVENEFYVSEITNYPESKFFESKEEEFCGQKSSFQTKYYKFYDIDRFYIKYKKNGDFWKH